MRFGPYPKYVDTGTPWLRRIPSHWKCEAGRRYFQQRRDPAAAGDQQLSVTQKYGVVPQTQFMEAADQKVVLALKGVDNFQHVERGDFVISLRSFQGGIERSDYVGCVSPAYTVLRATAQIHGKYWKRLFKSPGYISALQATTEGIREGKSISFEQFGRVPLPCPPIEEQVAIARFLDQETTRIDQLIEAQNELIELLHEKRKAVISLALTKGLHNAVTKASGIEWLGAIPSHWRVSKVGRHCSILSGYAFPSAGFSEDEGDIRLLRGVNVGVSRIKWDDVVYWKREPDDKLDTFLLHPGQVVVGMDRPWINEGARVAIVGYEDVPSLLLQRVAALTTQAGLDNRFLVLLLGSEMFAHDVIPETTGVSVPHISPSQISALPIPLPPIFEQVEIVTHIDNFRAKADELVEQAGITIDLLSERRDALVSSAVTGQIDVRERTTAEVA